MLTAASKEQICTKDIMRSDMKKKLTKLCTTNNLTVQQILDR